MASVVIKLFAIFVLLGISVSEDEVENKVAKQAVSDDCLECICNALSECRGLVCIGELCGSLLKHYDISRQFWVDSGSPTVSGQSPKDSLSYEKCTAAPHCVAQTIRGYLNRFAQDCNGDGNIDCRDYLAILSMKRNCNGDVPAKYLEVLKQCSVIKGI